MFYLVNPCLGLPLGTQNAILKLGVKFCKLMNCKNGKKVQSSYFASLVKLDRV